MEIKRASEIVVDGLASVALIVGGLSLASAVELPVVNGFIPEELRIPGQEDKGEPLPKSKNRPLRTV
ncbi:MAG TPA: hypothetical protein VLG25_02510 [Patescibacteria group bacterium]|nr:hypothetical protein [Patescibacteria group bacterium]